MNFLRLIKLHFLITWNDKRGAVVTHGSSLPDSAQKTDFYGIVDNATVTSIVAADISASAAIQDTQLNTISTAGKVNTSALTGQIANANLAQIVTPALVSGAALTLLPNVPSGAGLLPAANVGGLVGAAVSKTIGQIYQALTDGIVCAVALPTAQAWLQGLSDSSATPTTVISGNSNGEANQYCSVTMIVKKNNYYEVTTGGGSLSSSAMYFIPIGS